MNSFLQRISEPISKTNIQKSQYNVVESNNFADTVRDFQISIQNNEIQLPRKYNILLDQIRQAFTTFFCSPSYRASNSFPKYIDFSKLRTGIEQGGHSFTQETLERMLSIMPNGEFAVKWVEDGRLTRKYKLKAMMMYEPKVDDVVQRAKNILIGKLLKKHEEWCKINKIKLPEGINVFHSDFPLQEQVLIEPKKIPLPPAPAPTVEETIRMKEAEEYEALKPMIEERKAKFLAEKPAFTSNKVIMDRYADRCVKLECWKEVYGKNIEKKLKTSTIIALNKIIHQIFTSQKKTTLRLSTLASWIKKDKEYKADTDDATIYQLIDKVCSASNGYYQTFSCQNHDFIKYDSSKRFETVSSVIYQNCQNME